MKAVIAVILITTLAIVASVYALPALAAGSGWLQIHWLLAAFAILAVIARWRLIVRRRAKRKLEQMRDSALW
jgi:membrane protein implicated in regulation of membrane protease activity